MKKDRKNPKAAAPAKTDTLYGRISKRLKFLQMSETKASVAAGASEDYIRNIRRKEEAGLVHHPRSDMARNLAWALHTNEEWLLTGKGDEHATSDDYSMSPVQIDADDEEVFRNSGHIESDHLLFDEFLGRKKRAVITTLKKYEPTLPNGRPVVATFGGSGGGGTLSVFDDEAININGMAYSADAVQGEIVLPPVVYSSLARSDSSGMHWLNVVGDSMSGTLESGDWVGVDTSDKLIGQGGVFAVRDEITSEILVKRLRRIRGTSPVRIEIISDNPKQGNETELAELITVIGRVVARIARVG